MTSRHWIAICPRKRFVLKHETKVSWAATSLFRGPPKQTFLFVKGLFSPNLLTYAGIPTVVTLPETQADASILLGWLNGSLFSTLKKKLCFIEVFRFSFLRNKKNYVFLGDTSTVPNTSWWCAHFHQNRNFDARCLVELQQIWWRHPPTTSITEVKHIVVSVEQCVSCKTSWGFCYHSIANGKKTIFINLISKKT